MTIRNNEMEDHRQRQRHRRHRRRCRHQDMYIMRQPPRVFDQQFGFTKLWNEI